jgi:hypothetical protein
VELGHFPSQNSEQHFRGFSDRQNRGGVTIYGIMPPPSQKTLRFSPKSPTDSGAPLDPHHTSPPFEMEPVTEPAAATRSQPQATGVLSAGDHAVHPSRIHPGVPTSSPALPQAATASSNRSRRRRPGQAPPDRIPGTVS